jgi:hypothetical protein
VLSLASSPIGFSTYLEGQIPLVQTGEAHL